MLIWEIGTLNHGTIIGTYYSLSQLFIRGSYTEILTLFFVIRHFVLPTLFALKLTFDRSVLYGNVAISIVVLST